MGLEKSLASLSCSTHFQLIIAVSSAFGKALPLDPRGIKGIYHQILE